MDRSSKIALLIDCDNVSHSAVEGVLEELAKYDTANVRHAHRGWIKSSTPTPFDQV